MKPTRKVLPPKVKGASTLRNRGGFYSKHAELEKRAFKTVFAFDRDRINPVAMRGAMAIGNDDDEAKASIWKSLAGDDQLHSSLAALQSDEEREALFLSSMRKYAFKYVASDSLSSASRSDEPALRKVTDTTSLLKLIAPTPAAPARGPAAAVSVRLPDPGAFVCAGPHGHAETGKTPLEVRAWDINEWVPSLRRATEHFAKDFAGDTEMQKTLGRLWHRPEDVLRPLARDPIWTTLPQYMAHPSHMTLMRCLDGKPGNIMVGASIARDDGRPRAELQDGAYVFRMPKVEPEKASLSRLASPDTTREFNRLEQAGALRKGATTHHHGPKGEANMQSKSTTVPSTFTAAEVPLTRMQTIDASIDLLGLRINSGSNDPHQRNREDVASAINLVHRIAPMNYGYPPPPPPPVEKSDRNARLAKMAETPERYAVLNPDGTLNAVQTAIKIERALGGRRQFFKTNEEHIAAGGVSSLLKS